MLTRTGVAKRLGKSIATVRRMEGRELHPEVDENGVHLFDEDEVEDLAQAPGNIGHSARRFGPIDRSRQERTEATALVTDGLREDVAKLGAELTQAQRRIAELIADRDELQGLLRSTAWLLLEICPSSTLSHFDPRLVAMIRGLREL